MDKFMKTHYPNQIFLFSTRLKMHSDTDSYVYSGLDEFMFIWFSSHGSSPKLSAFSASDLEILVCLSLIFLTYDAFHPS